VLLIHQEPIDPTSAQVLERPVAWWTRHARNIPTDMPLLGITSLKWLLAVSVNI